MKVGEILLRKQVISETQLDQALFIQSCAKMPLGEILIRLGWINKTSLDYALEEQYWRNHGYWIIG
jgi:hypothetical protein